MDVLTIAAGLIGALLKWLESAEASRLALLVLALCYAGSYYKNLHAIRATLETIRDELRLRR